MIPYKYAYLVANLLFFIPWAILFWHRRDLRKAMVIMGIIGAVGSYALEHYEIIDWWHPATITGTKQGIEDLLLGFSNAGIATVLYVELTKKRFYHKHKSDHSHGLALLIAFTVFLFWLLFALLHLGTFLACIIALTVYSGVMLLYRKDLLISSVANGSLMVLVVLPIYLLFAYTSPATVEKFYIYPLVTGVRIKGIPLEEFIFYFIFGLMAALMYEYWQGLRLRKFATAKFSKKL